MTPLTYALRLQVGVEQKQTAHSCAQPFCHALNVFPSPRLVQHAEIDDAVLSRPHAHQQVRVVQRQGALVAVICTCGTRAVSFLGRRVLRRHCSARFGTPSVRQRIHNVDT